MQQRTTFTVRVYGCHGAIGRALEACFQATVKHLAKGTRALEKRVREVPCSSFGSMYTMNEQNISAAFKSALWGGGVLVWLGAAVVITAYHDCRSKWRYRREN